MKQSLQLRVSQHLALTPQLQQSIRLLQLSTLELHQELEQILSDNPLLERVDDPLDSAVRLLADGAISNTGTSSTDAPNSEATGSDDGADSSERGDGSDTPSNSDADWNFDSAPSSGKGADDEDARPQLEAHQTTLREHLLEQTRVTVHETRDRALLELVIDALDENGYLEEPLAEIHARLPEELEIELEELSIALALLQTFDPPGVGARSASECLALQVRRLPKIAFVTRRLALTIVLEHLQLFA